MEPVSGNWFFDAIKNSLLCAIRATRLFSFPFSQGVLLSGGGFRRPMHVAIKQTRPTFRAECYVGLSLSLVVAVDSSFRHKSQNQAFSTLLSRLGGGWGRNVPSDGFIFHPILNDRQDQTCCSDPVRALDRVEPYVCCREEGAEPSLNVRHPS
ncbi:hypothetical protein V6N12_076152 [Hibiscus sabdariffa]|uniref:Uncharacterized protein n=1 Tax=Hibiscus sabdariffa TaxID=183260 RepID=A0ABR2AUR2_9ROSI